MIVYRLSKEKYAATLSGIGAAISGGRWNSKQVEMIYTASSRALAMAEVAVHIAHQMIPLDYMMMEIYIPDSFSMQTIELDDLAEDWAVFNQIHATKKIGDEFIRSSELFLKVPSAVVQGDYNILINPEHPDFDAIQIINRTKFPFDKRLFL